MLAELRCETFVKATQLTMEYDPMPPLDAGTPEAAKPELTATSPEMMQDLLREELETAYAWWQMRVLAA